VDPALEGGEGPFEGAWRLFKVNPRVLCAEKGDDWGRHKFKFFGRPTAAQPDYAEALKALRGFVEPFRQVLNPLLTEAVEAYDGEKEKQDCEYRAFERLAAKLKKLFPRQAFCIVGDALYCSHPIMDICRGNKWEFVLTFKEGAMPKVYKAVQSAKLPHVAVGAMRMRRYHLVA